MTIETESPGETAGNQPVRQVSGPSRRPSGTSLGVAGRTEINWCHKPKQMSFLNLLVSTSRKEIRVRQLQGPEPRFGPSSQGLGLGLGAPSPRVCPGPRGLGPGPPERLGPPVFRRSEKSPGGWRRGGSQLNNYDETRSDHGPVGNTWLGNRLVTIDYATYLTIETKSSDKKLQEIYRCKKCQDHHAGQPVGSTWLCYILVAIDYATDL